MTGAEHYAEAELLGAGAWEQENDQATITLQAAQLHATLALAAFTAGAAGGHMGPTNTANFDPYASE